MTRDDIILMAREAGFEAAEYGLNCIPGMYAYNMKIVERFFAKAYDAGAKAEREAWEKALCEPDDGADAASRARGTNV